MRRTILPLGALLLAAAAPAAGQDNLLRRSFAYFDRTLTVAVAPGSDGVLHLLRGGTSRIEVAARTESGASIALEGHNEDQLRLSSAGSAEYTVVVPENIHLRLQLPDQDYAVPAPVDTEQIYRWRADPAATLGAGRAALPVRYDDLEIPAEMRLPASDRIRRVAVRTGTGAFRLSSSQILSLAEDRNALVVRSGESPVVIEIDVPAGTRDFSIWIGADEIVAVRAGQLSARCSPRTQQILEASREWIEWTPSEGRLRCP